MGLLTTSSAALKNPSFGGRVMSREIEGQMIEIGGSIYVSENWNVSLYNTIEPLSSIYYYYYPYYYSSFSISH